MDEQMDEKALLLQVLASVSIGAVVSLLNMVIPTGIRWQLVAAAGIGFAIGQYISF